MRLLNNFGHHGLRIFNDLGDSKKTGVVVALDHVLPRFDAWMCWSKLFHKLEVTDDQVRRELDR